MATAFNAVQPTVWQKYLSHPQFIHEKYKYVEFWYDNIAVKTKWFPMHVPKQDTNNIYNIKSCLYREADGARGF